MAKITLILLCIAAVNLCVYAACDKDKQFTVYQNENSKGINRYISELAAILRKDLQDKAYLKLNQTALNDLSDGVYVAVVVNTRKSSSSNYIVPLYNVNYKKKKTTSSSESESSSEEYSSEEFTSEESPES